MPSTALDIIPLVSYNYQNDPSASALIEIGRQCEKLKVKELIISLEGIGRGENKRTSLLKINKFANAIAIPFTLAGYVEGIKDVENSLNAGTSKVAIADGAYDNPQLIRDIFDTFGSGKCVCIVKGKQECPDEWICYKDNNTRTECHLFSWCRKLEHLGASDILFINLDKKNNTHKVLNLIQQSITIPLITAYSDITESENIFQTNADSKTTLTQLKEMSNITLFIKNKIC